MSNVKTIDEIIGIKQPQQSADSNVKSIDELIDNNKLDEMYTNRPQLPSFDQPGALQEKLAKPILSGIEKFGKTVDSYTGAPTRALIDAAQTHQNPLQAFARQFGKDPSLAPTGEDILVNAGAPRDNIMTKALGLGVDVGADPTMVVPVGAMAKGGVQVARMAGELGMGAARAGAKALAPIANVATKVTGLDSPLNGLMNIAKGAGNTAKNIAQFSGDAASSISKIFKPQLAADLPELTAIAQREGIDISKMPESIEFGQNSLISRASRQRAEDIGGEKYLNKFQDFNNQVQGAINKRVQQLSGGKPIDQISAGRTIREGYDEGVDKFFNQIDFTFNNIEKMAPGMLVDPAAQSQIASKIGGIEKYAKGQLERGITNADRMRGEQLLRAVAAIRNGNGSFKQTKEAMQQIGKVAFKTENILADVPPDIQKMRDLYFTLNDALVNTTGRQLGDKVASDLVVNNNAMKDFFNDKNMVSGLIGNRKISDENLFKSLIMNGDSARIAALQNIIGPERMNQLKGAFIENLVKRNPDGTFSLSTLHSALRNKEPLVRTLFADQELAPIADLIRLGDRAGKTPVLSTSGTGASLRFSDLPRSAVNAVMNDATIERLKLNARAQMPPGTYLPAVGTSTQPSSILSTIRNYQKTAPEKAAKGSQIYYDQTLNNDKDRAFIRRLKGQK